MIVSKEELEVITDLFRSFYAVMWSEEDVMDISKKLRIRKPTISELFKIYIYLRDNSELHFKFYQYKHSDELLRSSYLNSELCKMRRTSDVWNIYYYGDLMDKICAPIEVANFSNLCEMKCSVTIWS
jgi:hypothetical protein